MLLLYQNHMRFTNFIAIMRDYLQIYKIQKFKDIVLTVSGSGIEYGFLLILNLILARVLSVEDFGIVRAATAYLMVLQMCGHLTLQDSIAAQVARVQTPAEQHNQIRSGIFLVILASVILVLAVEVTLHILTLLTSKLCWTVQWMILIIPFSSLYLVFYAILPADGRYWHFFALRVISGILQLLVIGVVSNALALPGWIGGRLLSTGVLLVLAIGLCAPLLKWGPVNWHDCRAHLRFGAVQFPGAVMWMLFLNIDIIVLERVCNDPRAVGVYGFAALLVRSLAFVFNAAGAAFFRDLANAWLNPPTMLPVHGRFLLAMTALGIAVSLVALIAGQLLIAYVYGGNFDRAGSILSVLCLSVPLNALWIALSVINISGRRPQRSLAISAAGFVSSGAAIVPLITVYGPIGAAWAVVFGNSIGVAVGALPIILMVRTRRRSG